MREHVCFEGRSSKHAFLHVYVDFSLEVTAWTRIAEAGVNIASLDQVKTVWLSGGLIACLTC